MESLDIISLCLWKMHTCIHTLTHTCEGVIYCRSAWTERPLQMSSKMWTLKEAMLLLNMLKPQTSIYNGFMKSEHQPWCLEAMDTVLQNMANPTLNFIKVASATLTEKNLFCFYFICIHVPHTHIHTSPCQREDMWNTNATQRNQGTILKKSLLLQKWIILFNLHLHESSILKCVFLHFNCCLQQVYTSQDCWH